MPPALPLDLQAALLRHWLLGRTIHRAVAGREGMQDVATAVEGARVEHVYTPGRRLFIAFDTGLVLHSQLGVAGRWRRHAGEMALLPPDAWLALGTQGCTIVNVGGEVLQLLTRAGMERILAASQSPRLV